MGRKLDLDVSMHQRLSAVSPEPAHHAALAALSSSTLAAVHDAAARELHHVFRTGTGRPNPLSAKPAAGSVARSAPLILGVRQSNRCAVLQNP